MHKICTQVVCLNDKHPCRAAFRVNSRPFPSSPGPLYQNEGKCSAFDMEMIFPNKIHFHKKGCACGLGFWCLNYPIVWSVSVLKEVTTVQLFYCWLFRNGNNTLEILKLLSTVLLPCYQRLQITLPCATFVVQFLMLDACTSYDGSN